MIQERNAQILPPERPLDHGPPTVGVVTIGQSPRTDVMPDIAARLPPGTRVIERGALDHVGVGELARLAPRRGEEVLVTRLRDGTEVTLAEVRLMPLLQKAVDDVTGQGASVVAALCTGTLAGIRCQRPLLMPGPLVRNLVAAASPGGRIARLGVVVPAPGQIEPVRGDWSTAAGEVLVLAASPYGPLDGLARATDALAAWRPDLIVLDCLGFDGPMKQLVARAVGVPVVLPRTALAGALAALL
jgi:protein AroM